MKYLGTAGLKFKTPFKNFHTIGNSPNSISFSVLIIVGKKDPAVFTDELSVMGLLSDELPWLFSFTWCVLVPDSVAVSEVFFQN